LDKSPAAPVLKVALPLPLDRLFDYAAPEIGRGWIGCRVSVPFGHRRLVGVVAAVGAADSEPTRIKAILQRLDAQPLISGELLQTLRWVAGYYHHPLGEVLATALPGPLRGTRPLPQVGETWLLLSATGRRALAEGAARRGSRLAALLARLGEGAQPAAALDMELPGWRDSARLPRARAWFDWREGAMAASADAAAVAGPALNEEQAAALAAVSAAIGSYRGFLLDGVTGSGKTEIYLGAIAQVLAGGRQALVLVPEIALTPQLLRRFRERLPGRVMALHSALADGERARVWLAAARGEAGVVLGTRSAVFTPLPNAGLIVVDEEHDAAFKQADALRYSARDLALVRGRALAVPVLLGSATPSLESLANAEAGRLQRLLLPRRAGAARPPSVRVLDTRGQRLQDGLAPELIDALASRVERREQMLVFRNRRGFAPLLACRACGWHAECERCDAAYTLHRQSRRLHCHHCDRERPVPEACPSCGSHELKPLGHGTERLEESLAQRFPGIPVIRIDRDSTRRRGALDEKLDAARSGDACILVGTQMLAKGHDLPEVTLVAVLNADAGLMRADYRAAERLAQLVIQVAGRAGRADKPGQVMLQTLQPDHPLLHTLLSGGYPAFAREELALRRATGLPPYVHHALVRAEAPDMVALRSFLQAARECAPASAGVQLHGPMPAPSERRAGRWRMQILLESSSRPDLQGLLGEWMPRLRALPQGRRVRWSLDVDPLEAD
jgi:primosomal protein N' (replication factor Y) (superfamily II helicase)